MGTHGFDVFSEIPVSGLESQITRCRFANNADDKVRVRATISTYDYREHDMSTVYNSRYKYCSTGILEKSSTVAGSTVHVGVYGEN